jgi:segregation and condensation protein A
VGAAVTSPYQVELAMFEGPLDLLLHLIKKHELDILDIPIAFITEKYLEYLERMRGLNLDIAGEYLLMAATLAHIKSRELLPTPDPAQADEEGVDEIDPRQELIRRLLEYQKYREAAFALGERPVMGRNVFGRGAPVPAPQGSEAPLAEVSVFKLIEALGGVLERTQIKLTHDVLVDRVSIAEQIGDLASRLERENAFTFESCFQFGDEVSEVELRNRVVVTFLALLEMTRLKMIRLHQPEGSASIFITRSATDLAAALAGLRPEEYAG